MYDDLHEDNTAQYTKHLEDTIKALQQENTRLRRNISCLFRTAQAEIARKDKEIAQLREK